MGGWGLRVGRCRGPRECPLRAAIEATVQRTDHLGGRKRAEHGPIDGRIRANRGFRRAADSSAAVQRLDLRESIDARRLRITPDPVHD